MKIVVTGPAALIDELRKASNQVEWIDAESVHAFQAHSYADAYFNLDENAARESYPDNAKPIFINSVTYTLSDIPAHPSIIRINGWPGFLSRKTWEVAGSISPAMKQIFTQLEKKFIVVADEPGFISARVLAMIINEAYFAKGEEVSTEKDIDIAMRLGTNYPKGPFEWAAEIGRYNIIALLNKLSSTDSRYIPAPLLKEAANV